MLCVTRRETKQRNENNISPIKLFEKIINSNTSPPKFRPSLLLPEPFSLLDCVVQLLHQLVVALVRRQIQPVEARVRPRQPRVLTDLLDAEPLRPVGAHQLGKAAHRNAARPRHKLQQPGALFVVGFADKLKDSLTGC